MEDDYDSVVGVKIRKNTIKPSLLKAFDKSMSAFHPRTSRFGNLPHLSCIDRKPEPLGTELKVTNTTTIGVGLYLEIQKGCEAMADAEFVSDMKKRQPVVAEWQRVQ